MALLPVSTSIDYAVRVPPAPPAPQPLVAEPKASSENGGTEADTKRQPQEKDVPQLPLRPPGVDPSVPPQTLIDASLIAEEFRANRFTVASAEEVAQSAIEAAESDDDEATNVSVSSSSDSDDDDDDDTNVSASSSSSSSSSSASSASSSSGSSESSDVSDSSESTDTSSSDASESVDETV